VFEDALRGLTGAARGLVAPGAAVRGLREEARRVGVLARDGGGLGVEDGRDAALPGAVVVAGHGARRLQFLLEGVGGIGTGVQQGRR